MHVNAARIGPDGKLWVVDAGNTGIGTGAKAVAGASKLVRIDLATNRVDKVFSFKAPIQGLYSYFDDVRFNGHFAYITDPGEKSLVVVNLQNGQAWRVLQNHPLSIDHLPIYAEGKKLYLANGNEKRVGLDQLEVSPDGKYLYYQPVPVPMARIESQYLDNPTLTSAEVAKQAKHWLATWSTGGTAIDSEGNIYSSDVNNSSIKRISPAGKVTTVIADPRLVWVDAMWIQGGYLWMPAGQN